MQRSFRNVLLATVVVSASAACTDLMVEPRSTVSSANIFNEASSYRAFIAKLYAGLAVTGQQGPAGAGDIAGIDEGFSHYIRLIWQMQELPTDEAGIAWNDAGVQELNTQLWSSSNQFLVSMYYRIFFQVSLANEFLRETTDDRLTARNVSPALRGEIAQYRAEARFLRALSYWHAIDLFGGVPLVDETFPIGRTPPAQATREELVSWVASELQDLRGALPPARGGEYGRADQGAVAMLLAKLYLNAEVYTGSARWSDARAEAEQVIAGGYQLDPNYRRMFSADNHTSPELVFTVPQDGTRQQSFGGTTFLINASVGGNMDASNYGIAGGWWGLRLKPQALALFPNAPVGPDRRASYVVASGHSAGMANITDFFSGYPAPKFTNVTSTGEPGSNREFADTDYPMFRMGDAMLMYAEAVLRGGGGDRAQALTYVNLLRQRAYGSDAGQITDAQLTLDFILDERLRELLWEGHRRTDLIRFGRFTTSGVWAWKGNTETGRTTEAFRNLYPLPASELLSNPNLTQNAGY